MNDDLISRAEAIDAMSESLKRVFPEHRQIAEKCLKALPSAQPQRKKGHWIRVGDGYTDYFRCSECGELSDYEGNFCSDCGCDMTEGTK